MDADVEVKAAGGLAVDLAVNVEVNMVVNVEVVRDATAETGQGGWTRNVLSG